MFAENMAARRRASGLTQEALAEAVGVSRQTISEWERGATAPDLERAAKLACALDVALDDLVSYDSRANRNLPMPPRGKHIFDTVTVGARGHIAIPKAARELFGINQSDTLLVLGDEAQGIAMLKADAYLEGVNAVRALVETMTAT